MNPHNTTRTMFIMSHAILTDTQVAFCLYQPVTEADIAWYAQVWNMTCLALSRDPSKVTAGYKLLQTQPVLAGKSCECIAQDDGKES